MFGSPRPRLNIRAVIRDMLEEEHELLLVLGHDFLNERLDDVEARLTRWQHYLETYYSDDTPPPRGDADRMRTYQIARGLIKQLAAESETQPFPVVYRRALYQAHRRIESLSYRSNFSDPSLCTALRKARLERDVLIELWPQWCAWLKPHELSEQSV